MRIIDADELKKAIETYDKFACLPSGKLEPFRNLEHSEMFEPYVHLRDIRNAIDNAPTVEARPHGEWNCIQAGMYICPFCGAIPHKLYKNFCPNCGTNMGKR